AGRQRLLEERQRVLAQIEQLDAHVAAARREIEDPLRRLVAETVRAGAAEDDLDVERAHRGPVTKRVSLARRSGQHKRRAAAPAIADPGCPIGAVRRAPGAAAGLAARRAV